MGANVKRTKLRDKILAAKDIKEETYEVPEWDVTLLLRGMTAKQRGRVMQACTDPKTGAVSYEKMYPKLTISGCFDPETKEAVFDDSDNDSINEKDGGIVETIAMKIMNLSGTNKDALADAIKN